MQDEFVSLKMLIASEAGSERAMIRRAATQASIPIDVTELDAVNDATAALEILARETFDVVLFDSRISRVARQQVLDGIRAAKGNPLAILIGAAEMKSREVLTEGLAVDGVLAKPIDEHELRDLIGNCIKARLPKRVLIVDDSSTVRAIIRKVLQGSRFCLDAEEAGEGASAIERARQQQFDIIFLDCYMPGLDGFATLDQIRRTQQDVRVVMISGARDARIEDRARAGGAVDFLYKPFFADDINSVLNRLFGLMRPRWN